MSKLALFPFVAHRRESSFSSFLCTVPYSIGPLAVSTNRKRAKKRIVQKFCWYQQILRKILIVKKTIKNSAALIITA